MSSVFSVSASAGFRNPPQHEPLSLVTVTSIQTETVHPTWVFTLIGNSTSSATSTGGFSIPASSVLTISTELSSDISGTTSTSTSPYSTTSETLAPAHSPMTPASSPMETHSTSTAESTTETSSTNVPSTMYIAPPLTRSSTQASTDYVTSPTSSISSISSRIPTTTSNPQTKTTPLIGIVTGANTTSAPIDASPSTKTSILVGSIIGGCAVLIFLVAIAFCIRRHRSPERGIKQHLLRNSISSRHSSPTPPSMSLPPPIPVIAAYSNPDLSLDSMYLRREQARNFATRPLVEISPSRMASFYSTSSWDGGLGLQEYWDLERGELTKHESMRSNPFDLEPPPSAHRPPVLVPVPTPWGVKF